MAELKELLSEAEDPYFELKNGNLRAVERLFHHEVVLAQLCFYFSEVRNQKWGSQDCIMLVLAKKSARKVFLYLAKLDMDNDQLLANYERCATSGSKVMIRKINEPK